MERDVLIKVKNRGNGLVGYNVDELGVRRLFYPGETKEITFNELEKLSFVPGGTEILQNYLEIDNKEAILKLFNKMPEIEYFYSRDDIKNLMLNGTLEQFLDCLDFAPEGVKAIIKEMAVNLPLYDMQKREAIQEKLGFNVTKAIEIKETKYDGGDEAEKTVEKTQRRVAPLKKDGVAITPSGRRYKPENK